MEQFVFVLVLAAICTPIAWGTMWWLVTRKNRAYIRYLVSELECSDGKEEADESAQASSDKERH